MFLKTLTLGKSKRPAAWFHFISIALKSAYNRDKLLKTFRYWSRDMLNFDIWGKGLGIVSSAHFVYAFQQNCSSCYILVTDQIFIAWLPLLLEILGNMCTRFFFLRKPFFCLSLNFLNITLKIMLRFSWYFFLTFSSLFFLMLYLIRFNINSKRHF